MPSYNQITSISYSVYNKYGVTACFMEYEASYWLTGTVHCEPTCQSLKAIEKGYSYHNKATRLQQLYITTCPREKKSL